MRYSIGEEIEPRDLWRHRRYRNGSGPARRLARRLRGRAGAAGRRLRMVGDLVRPEISIVIPVWNDGRYLAEAVESVRALVDVDWELIIADDGSEDPATLEVLAQYAAAGVEVLRLPHRGTAATRNAALRRARANVMLPLDADNRLRPTFARRALDALDSNPDVDVVYGPWQRFGAHEETVDPPEFDLDRLLGCNFIDTCAVFRRRVWERTGGYDPGMVFWADWAFWLAAASAACRFVRLGGEVTFDYRVRDSGSLTARFGGDDVTRRAMRKRVFSRHADLYRRRIGDVLFRMQEDSARGFAAKDEYIGSLRRAVAAKDHYVGSLLAVLTARDRELNDLKAAIAKLAACIRGGSSQFSGKHRGDSLARALEDLVAWTGPGEASPPSSGSP